MDDGRDIKEIISEVDADNVSPLLNELNILINITLNKNSDTIMWFLINSNL